VKDKPSFFVGVFENTYVQRKTTAFSERPQVPYWL